MFLFHLDKKTVWCPCLNMSPLKKITVKKVRFSTVWGNREWIIVGALCCVINGHTQHLISLVSSLPVSVCVCVRWVLKLSTSLCMFFWPCSAHITFGHSPYWWWWWQTLKDFAKHLILCILHMQALSIRNEYITVNVSSPL